MSCFNLNFIIKKYDLNVDLLAQQLFPENKFPKSALERILDGKAFLDTNQLVELSKITNTQISELFTSSTWSPKEVEGKLVFVKGNFKVELHLDTFITNIYRKDKLVVEDAIICKNSIKLSEYLELVNKTIIELI